MAVLSDRFSLLQETNPNFSTFEVFCLLPKSKWQHNTYDIDQNELFWRIWLSDETNTFTPAPASQH